MIFPSDKNQIRLKNTVKRRRERQSIARVLKLQSQGKSSSNRRMKQSEKYLQGFVSWKKS